MPDTSVDFLSPGPRKRLAVIGGGISGLGAAWLLKDQFDITLFEAEERLGGHARTCLAGPDRNIPVDTGFMVFNSETYPNLIRMFGELGVASVETSMSFAVSLDNGDFEYGLTNLSRVLAQPLNAISPQFIGMVRDIVKFNRHAEKSITNNNMSLGELLMNMDMGDAFCDRYLYPLAGAIWSTARDDMHSFPASSFVRFFKNHGLLSAHNGPKWRTVSGGSRSYVDKLASQLEAAGVTIKTGSPATAVGRSPTPWVKIADAEKEAFDQLIMATHADQTKKLLSDASSVESEILGALKYRPNKAFLHGDISHMPKRKNAWSCWVYRGDSKTPETTGSFTYWMNELQHIDKQTPVFVTLNPKSSIREDLIYDETTFYHPQFDLSALEAQQNLPSIQGLKNTWFCGAYARYGFHEDGLWSAVEVANRLTTKELKETFA